MAKKKSSKADWAEAKRRCRLSEEDVRKAKELGFLPKSLIKNIPSRSQPWKTSVSDWVRGLYEKKIEKAAKKRARREKANQRLPKPEPEVPNEDRDVEGECHEGWSEEVDFSSELTDKDIRETNQFLRKRQQELCRAAEVVAEEFAKSPQVQKVVLFGSVAMPLEKEIPRFREYRRDRIAVWHECADVDLAVWLSDLDHLKSLHRARIRALNELWETNEIGVAHHQIDIFLMDGDRYIGRLCHFGQCPKEGKTDCFVDGCGQKRFLQKHEGFILRPESLAPDKSVVLFDRTEGA